MTSEPRDSCGCLKKTHPRLRFDMEWGRESEAPNDIDESQQHRGEYRQEKVIRFYDENLGPFGVVFCARLRTAVSQLTATFILLLNTFTWSELSLT
ncbi:hypothetical protein STEG23_037311, partial [Scotinomys teguina]